MADAVPPIPPLPVARLLKLRDRLVAECKFVGDTLQLEQLQEWLLTVSGRTGASPQVLLQSCRYLLGKPVSFQEVQRLAWRLAGNLERLCSGIPVYAFRAVSSQEWCAIQIVESQERRVAFKNQRRDGALCTIRVLTGQPAGELTSQWLSRRYCQYLTPRVGFTQPRGNRRNPRPFTDLTQLTGIRLAAYTQLPDPRNNGTLRFEVFGCPSGMQTFNVDKLKGRYRASGACPNGWTHDCAACLVGYDSCMHATHAKTFAVRNCVACDNAQAVFDPRDPALCVECRRKTPM